MKLHSHSEARKKRTLFVVALDQRWLIASFLDWLDAHDYILGARGQKLVQLQAVAGLISAHGLNLAAAV